MTSDLAPDVAAFIDALSAAPPLYFREMTVGEARAAADAIAAQFDLPGDPTVRSQDATVTSASGVSIPVRRYQPATGGAGPLIVYFHGGGWLTGSLDGYDSFCRYLAASTGLSLVSVAYRLAPEHPFPAAFDDGLAVTLALAGETEAGLILAGDSAGGGLAAALSAQLAGPESPVRAQMLLYPVLDVSKRHASYDAFGRGFLLDAGDMAHFIAAYVPHVEDRTDPRCSPLLSSRLGEVAPIVLLACDHDPLCDEARAFSQACREAGTRVRMIEAQGQIHGIATLRAAIPSTQAIFEAVTAALGEELQIIERTARKAPG